MASVAPQAQAEDKLKIAFGTPYSSYALPYLVAKDLGWFKQDGLEIEDLILNSDSNATRTMISGFADVAMTGQLNVFNVDENGIAVQWIGAWQPVNDYEIIAPPQITKMEDLVDKTFAASGPSGSPQLLPVLIFKKLGLPTDKIQFVAVGGHSVRLQTVLAGKADATLVNEITAAIGVNTGKVHILAPVQQYLPNIGYVILAVRSADIPKKRHAFEGLMRGSIRGARYIMQNPEKSAEVLHHYLPDLEIGLLTQVVTRLNAQKVWGVNGGLDPEVEQFTAQMTYDTHDTNRLFKFEEVVDTSIVDAVLKTEGRVPQ